MGKLKAVEDILKEMGFNEDAKTSTQLSLYKHLKKAANAVQTHRPPVQLEFDLEGLKSGSEPPAAKKVSSR